ncbi:Phosphoenolpyruvate-dihydroxyacetone phosphotransferase [Actinosynnema pretiosum subsp. pretiosum]|nr:Phosphoenolpyruvate-dihydroxyacetone phosphotransferase [Actinosynnema pretiosum subsp. pretiosum]
MSVGIVVVSHSRKLAEGVVELAGQMAPEVRLVAVGGDGGGGLGTDYAAVVEGLADADGGGGVVVLFDLGSARMVADLAVEEFGGAAAVVDAPLVTGAVAAAVAAQGGAALEAVVAAALGARGAGSGRAVVPPVTALTVVLTVVPVPVPVPVAQAVPPVTAWCGRWCRWSTTSGCTRGPPGWSRGRWPGWTRAWSSGTAGGRSTRAACWS